MDKVENGFMAKQENSYDKGYMTANVSILAIILISMMAGILL